MADAPVALDDRAARERVERVEALLEAVDALSDPNARDVATELVQALLELYGEGLARLVGVLADHDDGGAMARAVADDELIAHLLLLHGLHPEPLDARVRRALDEVRPYLDSHGGGVELLGVQDGVVRLELEGSCNGCPSSAATLELAIEDAIQRAAPDVVGIEAQGAVEPEPPPLLQLGVSEALRPRAEPAWATVGPLPALDGAQLAREVQGEQVLFVGAGGAIYAYRPACPACGAALTDGTLGGLELTCAGCGRRYDVRAAGRCADDAALHLEPVPLLVDGAGAVKVALGAPA
jgi:Fe-S cluster biogenesis protein NfuA/nitrite reductase/ring-hydroxylating ferredoxin subunit